MTPKELLAQLYDIRGLGYIDWWPLAPGWWVLLGLALIVAGVVWWRRWAYYRSWKGEAWWAFAALEARLTADNAQDIAASLSSLMRRIAIQSFSRAECAGLEGPAWLGWLTAKDPGKFDWSARGTALIEAPYAPPGRSVSPQSLTPMIAAAKRWVKYVFSFAWPWMVVLLALPFLVRLAGAGAKAASAAPEIYFPQLDRLKAIFPGQSQNRKAGRFYLPLLGLIWLCLTLALMQPQLVDQFTQLEGNGYDLMLAVDLSGSMETPDYTRDGEQVSRLDIIKSVVSDFVSRRQGDRVGLVLFGTNAYLHVPLTLDTQSVRKMLNNTMVGEAGTTTAIGDAIGLAVRSLRERPEKSRIIILMTDGVDNASTIPPLEAAKLARQYGIRIYTIGVGSKTPMAATDQNGQAVMADSDLDEGLLQKISSITGGAYFRAADTEALQKIYAQINRLEKTQAGARGYIILRPLYRYPLGGALALLLLLSLLPVFKARRHGL